MLGVTRREVLKRSKCNTSGTSDSTHGTVTWNLRAPPGPWGKKLSAPALNDDVYTSAWHHATPSLFKHMKKWPGIIPSRNATLSLVPFLYAPTSISMILACLRFGRQMWPFGLPSPMHWKFVPDLAQNEYVNTPLEFFFSPLLFPASWIIKYVLLICLLYCSLQTT